MDGNVLEFFTKAGIRLSENGGRIKLRGPLDLPPDLKEKAVALAKEHKAGILVLIAEPTPGRCETCKGAGFWDYRDYAGKMLCFHTVMFLGKPGRPFPCSEVRRKCPLGAGDDTN